MQLSSLNSYVSCGLILTIEMRFIIFWETSTCILRIVVHNYRLTKWLKTDPKSSIFLRAKCGCQWFVFFWNQYLLWRLLRKIWVTGFQWFVVGRGVANILVSEYTRALYCCSPVPGNTRLLKTIHWECAQVTNKSMDNAIQYSTVHKILSVCIPLVDSESI